MRRHVAGTPHRESLSVPPFFLYRNILPPPLPEGESRGDPERYQETFDLGGEDLGVGWPGRGYGLLPNPIPIQETEVKGGGALAPGTVHKNIKPGSLDRELNQPFHESRPVFFIKPVQDVPGNYDIVGTSVG
jgi:hypothetical protein